MQVASGDDGLVAVHALDALADEILASGLGLGDKIRVGYVHTAQADEVTYALLEQLLRGLRVTQGVDGNNGDVDGVLYGLDEGAAPALGRVAGLYHRGRAGIDAAADVEVIDVGLQVLGDLDAGVLVVAALDKVVAVDARADNEVGAYRLADALEYAHEEAAAVFHRAAVLVRALVGVRAEELLNQVAVRGVNLNAICTGGFRVDGGLNKQPDQAVDVFNGHFPRQYGVAAYDAVELNARSHGLPAAVEGGRSLASAVLKLDEYLGAVAMDCVADVLHSPDLPGVEDAELVTVALSAFRVDASKFGNNKAAAALGALLVEAYHFRSGTAIPVAEHYTHSGHYNPVGQLQPAYFTFLKQFFVFHIVLPRDHTVGGFAPQSGRRCSG